MSNTVNNSVAIQISPNVAEVLYPIKTAYDIVVHSLSLIGRVKNENRSDNIIEGRVRYGLQSAVIKVSFEEIDDEKTKIFIQGSSDDHMNVAGESAVQRLMDTIINYNNPDFKPDQSGVSVIFIIGCLVLFIFLLFLVDELHEKLSKVLSELF